MSTTASPPPGCGDTAAELFGEPSPLAPDESPATCRARSAELARYASSLPRHAYDPAAVAASLAAVETRCCEAIGAALDSSHRDQVPLILAGIAAAERNELHHALWFLCHLAARPLGDRRLPIGSRITVHVPTAGILPAAREDWARHSRTASDMLSALLAQDGGGIAAASDAIDNDPSSRLPVLTCLVAHIVLQIETAYDIEGRAADAWAAVRPAPAPAPVEEPAAPAPLPTPTMTVTVRDKAAERPWGSGPTDPRLRTVTVPAVCPRCGGPRGEPKSTRQHEDGVTFYVDTWLNPCEHVDSYADVLAEADALAARADAGAAEQTPNIVPAREETQQ